MNEFRGYHPAVNFIYFVSVIGFSMFLMHPICLLISFICAISYSALQRGGFKNKGYVFPMIIAAALINPALNHEGVTILCYLPGGNPLTLESIVYGLAASVMIAGVIFWFACYNRVMSDDKFVYLFGKAIPSLSLILSMIFRFIPEFREEIKDIADAQRCLGMDVSNGSVVKRAKHGMTVISAMITKTLENAVDTADSMRSRGYGLPGRTSFSIFEFDKRDFSALLFIIICALYILAGGMSGSLYFRYFPSLKSAQTDWYGISVFVAYAFLCFFPIFIEVKEVIRWKALRSKI